MGGNSSKGQSNQTPSNGNDVNIVIVGGGVAGLAAAKTLTESGISVSKVILEAQSYLGGRVCTIDATPNLVIDLGAQYIHGEKNNQVFDICNEIGCLAENQSKADKDSLFITTDGVVLPSELSESISEVCGKIVENAGNESYSSSLDYFNSDAVLGQINDVVQDESLSRAIVDWAIKGEMDNIGAPSLNDVSLTSYNEFEDSKGNDERQLDRRGFRPFIDHLRSSISSQEIRLNSEVTKVTYDSERQKMVVNYTNLNNQQKSTIQCDHIIWTTSLGYLKENFTRIFSTESSLIEEKQQAIENIGFGLLNKVVMIYREKFWPEEIYEINLLHTSSDKPYISPSFAEFLKREKVDINAVKTIMKNINNYTIILATSTPTLACPISGVAARLMEDVSENVLGRLCHEVLSQCFPAANEQNRPIQVVKTAWYQNRFVRGAYSYHSVRSTPEDLEHLQKPYAPDGVQRISFAGEAVHPRFFSTIHGAFESGVQTAEQIISVVRENH